MALYAKLGALLVKAGLSEAEKTVYISLLKKPSQTRWELNLRTKLGRNKVYRAFDSLLARGLISVENGVITANSLQSLVEDLNSSSRKTGKLADKIRKIAPFLRMANESFEDFEILFEPNDILEKYIFMSEVKYGACLDFGDLEGFVPVVGGLENVFKFRKNRFKQMASNYAICTTEGPFTKCMSRKNDMCKFNSAIDRLNIGFKKKWIIFSDTNQYVMFNDFSDIDVPSAVFVRSKVVADVQRMYFKEFSQKLENF